MGIGSAGAMAAAVLIALTPALAMASPALALPHATPDLYAYYSQSGCAKAGSTHPTFSTTTGAGHVSVHAAAKTCPVTKGGFVVGSYGSAAGQTGASETMKLTHSYTNLNATWGVNAAWLLNASGKITHCPTHYYNFSYPGTYGNTSYTFYFNESYQDCYAQAGVEYYLETEVYDVTTSTYSFFFGPFNYTSAGPYSNNYTLTEQYNPLPSGFSNYSYVCTTCYGNYGPGGSGTVNTNLYANLTGSWSAGDTVTISAVLWTDAYAEIYYAHSGHAVASWNAAGATHHADLTGLTLS